MNNLYLQKRIRQFNVPYKMAKAQSDFVLLSGALRWSDEIRWNFARKRSSNELLKLNSAFFVSQTGNSHPDLAQKIADRLGIKLANCSLYHSSNRESRVDIGDSVRARDCYIIQTGRCFVSRLILIFNSDDSPLSSAWIKCWMENRLTGLFLSFQRSARS